MNNIFELAQYNIGFEKLTNNNNNETVMVVHITYPKGWKIINSEQSIKMLEQDGITYYWIDNSVELEPIFKLINETIGLNKDLEERFILLNKKIEELKNLFIEEDLSKLKTLYFEFSKPVNIIPDNKKTAKSKKRRTSKKENKEIETKVEETPINTEESNDNANKTIDNETETVICDNLIDQKIMKAINQET